MNCELVNSVKVRLLEEKESSGRLTKMARSKKKTFDEAYNLGREAAYEMALTIIENEFNRIKAKDSIRYDFTQATRVKRVEKN